MQGARKRAAEATGPKALLKQITFYGNAALHKLSCH